MLIAVILVDTCDGTSSIVEAGSVADSRERGNNCSSGAVVVVGCAVWTGLLLLKAWAWVWWCRPSYPGFASNVQVILTSN